MDLSYSYTSLKLAETCQISRVLPKNIHTYAKYYIHTDLIQGAMLYIYQRPKFCKYVTLKMPPIQRKTSWSL